MIATLLICMGFSIIITIIVLNPLFSDKQQSYFSRNTKANEFDESLSILEAISELETDFKMGKISKQDYQKMSVEYQRHYLKSKKKEPYRKNPRHGTTRK